MLSAGVSVHCSVSGGGGARQALRVRVVKGAHVLGTARTLLRGTQASTTLSTTKPLPRGSYTLRVVLSSASGVIGSHQTVKLG